MEIIIHRKCCKAIFHTDCPDNQYGGIVQEHAFLADKSKTLVECLDCHQKGIILRGTSFHTTVRIDEVPEDFSELFAQCKPLSKTMANYLAGLSDGERIDLDAALSPDDD